MSRRGLSWRARIAELYADARLNPPVSTRELEAVESEFGHPLPDDLRSCLLETNGVAVRGADVVWAAREIAEQNLVFRRHPDFPALYMPFDCLLFFGGRGNGDQFAYRVLQGRVADLADVYEWDHETDSRTWFARGLDDCLRRAIQS